MKDINKSDNNLNHKTTSISIITVCYNSEATIERTIKSVLLQDYTPIEYIIIDGNSKDGTLEIIKKYRKNITKVISEPDKGIYDAMNKGIELASGEIIGILNSDDIYTSDTIISEIVGQFVKRDIQLLYGNITFFKNNPNKAIRTWVTKPYYEGFFEHGEVAPHPSLFVKKEVYNKIGTYQSDFKITSDYEFMLRALRINNYKSYHFNKFIVNMQMGGESTKSIKNIMQGNKEITISWKINGISPPIYFWPLRIYKKIKQYFS
ncbi:glycosyltransferase family 2 protein [Mucilaginibacter xinganensis]|uniref:Family 2 glycosyl transferase n=1 Tax=Mucilaginibacter xinganensis TaxID=1234841 RepID=A0A223NZ15_9SPHI|nr:glycosyltransferase family 2 protein [Mucilaginibacter xinganensis]ASU35127.1 family 2 glycosyl transferase [Mucilaginibacter xinganensis]